ncbi:MAG TPA: hypothetical protein VIL13_12230, partial [Longimicrobiales bacterium]
MVTSADLSRLRISREVSRASPAGGRRRLVLFGVGAAALGVLLTVVALVAGDRAVEVRTATVALRGGGGRGGGGLTANGY